MPDDEKLEVVSQAYTLEKIADSETNYMPYGLAYIASYAKSRGHIIDTLDLRKMSYWNQQLKPF